MLLTSYLKVIQSQKSFLHGTTVYHIYIYIYTHTHTHIYIYIYICIYMVYISISCTIKTIWKCKWSHSVVSDSIDCSLPLTVAYRLLHPWDFPGKSTRVGCHFLLQGIFPTQGSNLGLPPCRQMLYPLSHQGSPIFNYLSTICWKDQFSLLNCLETLSESVVWTCSVVWKCLNL